MKVTTTINLEIFQDLIVTALEGGSNAWYDIHDDLSDIKQKHNSDYISESIAREIWNNPEFELDIYDLEDEEEFLGTLTKESCEKAFQILLDKYPSVFANIINEEYDANDADIFFQLAVMGEIVFG